MKHPLLQNLLSSSNSRERYILIALSKGVSPLSIAAALDIPSRRVREIAARAMAQIKEAGDWAGYHRDKK